MNVWTGEKEAKINVPDEVDPSLEGLPVDQAVMVVDPEHQEAPPVPKGAPVYDMVGKIKEPQDGYEGKAFFEAIKIMKSGTIQDDQKFDEALEGMEELAHDMYYGLKLAEDPVVVNALLCLMADQSKPFVQGVTPRDQQAAAILSGALQNNPSALAKVTEQWPSLMEATCANTGKPLREGLFASFMPSDQKPKTSVSVAASKAKAKVSALNGLIKSDIIRADFLRNNGMQRLLEVLIPSEKPWEQVQRRVGLLALDNFLDEDMGAKLGQWPRSARVSDAECRKYEGQSQEGCWDYHVLRLRKENKADKSHWSKDLSDRLTKVRKNGKVPGKEL